jgi:hypothetical protein
MSIRQALEFAGRRQWNRACFVDLDILVKLARQFSLEIVTVEFRLRPLDDTDGALQPRLSVFGGGVQVMASTATAAKPPPI